MWLLLTAALLVAVGLRPLSADALPDVLTGYSLISWGQKDGLPPGIIWAIAQDREGYLWLGTDAGLMRFDGVRFVLWESQTPTHLPDAPVRAVSTSHDGSVWLGFDEPGGVSRLLNGGVRNYGERDGIASGAITMVLQEPDGAIWAANRAGLYRFVDERWKSEGKGLPRSVIYRTLVDRRGSRFVATADGLFQRDVGESSFHRVEGFDGIVRDITEDRFGRIWVTDPIVGFRHLGTPRKGSAETGNGSRLFQDSKGNLWVGSFGQGLWRARAGQELRGVAVERMSTLNGLSDDGVTSILEDRDGNIWAATYDGLNRLAPHKMTAILSLGVISGIEETTDGSVWVGAVDSLIEFKRGRVDPRRVPQPFHGAPPSAIHADRSGTLWVATTRELLRIVGGRSSVVSLPGQQLTQINAITSDLQGGLWLADRELGVYRWFQGSLKPLELSSEFRGAQVLVSLGDRSGRIWFSYADGRVVVANIDGTVDIVVPHDGTGGVYRAIYEDRDGAIWLGGNEGRLGKFANGRFTTLGRKSGLPAGSSVIAIVGDDAGMLWLGLEGTGVVRVNPEELVKTANSSSYSLRYSLYDKADGFGGAPRWRGNSSTARGEDGRLWFVSARGVTTLEPHNIEEGRAAAVQVAVEGVLVDGQKVRLTPQVQLPARTASVEIDYTVPNLASPLKTRFRYRLEGFDADWIEAGTRRQAFFTNLPPRRYRFRVVASNNDGTWNDGDAIWEFTIRPRFYQTGWFLAACIAMAILVPWTAWRLRIRQVRKQFAILLAERARLSREIHDTVLQGLMGVALQCDVISKDLDSSSASATKERLVKVRRDAEEYVRETRQSILNLRSPKMQFRDLAGALREAGERATAGTPIAFSLAVSGTPSRHQVNAEEQLFRIGQEALANAVRHAHAREVRVELRYDDPSVILRISDDGQGFDPDIVTEADGHCGLFSMQERAKAAGGILRITTAVGRGAQIEAIVPTSSSAI